VIIQFGAGLTLDTYLGLGRRTFRGRTENWNARYATLFPGDTNKKLLIAKSPLNPQPARRYQLSL
jgi:hypothetical protein